MAASRFALAWVVAAVLAVAMAGCARYYWSKSGATTEQFDRDNTECAREASANPTEAAHGMVNEKLYRACLKARKLVQQLLSELFLLRWNCRRVLRLRRASLTACR